MPRTSPPKHRHDGTSPLPLGMDWSPPPKKWDGKNTVWPHDPHTGWSYCVMIPSWIVQPESRGSTESLLNPVIFYRVLIGVQSPEGVSTCRGIIRRFSDFLKLFSALKKAFPKKNIPSAPPKHALLRINSSRMLLEERRQALEEWTGKLLSDIDISRSAAVAAFLELEVAARSAFQDINSHTKATGSSFGATDSSSLLPIKHIMESSVTDWSKVASSTHSAASDFGSDNYEVSDLETPELGKLPSVNDSPVLDLNALKGAGANGSFGGDMLLKHPEDLLKDDLLLRKENFVLQTENKFGSSSKMKLPVNEPEHDYEKLCNHSRKHSDESIGSDISSVRGSELSNPGISNSTGDGSIDLPGGSDAPYALESLNRMDVHSLSDEHIVLPLDHRHQLNRILVTMQRRLATTRTDMEDLVARLNQEVAIKEYLATKVKDLEGELEATKQKSKENLQQALVAERERVTQMQWDMDELRRKCMEMESKLKFEQNEKSRAESEQTNESGQKEHLLEELDSKQKKLETLQKRLEDLEVKSKADIKVLVKEVKSLRNSQADLKEALGQSLKEKMELERALQKENQNLANAKTARKKLLHECEVLRHRLEECSANFLAEDEDKFTVSSSSMSDALELLATSDSRISLLIAEAQLLARDDFDDDNSVADAYRDVSRESFEHSSQMNGDIGLFGTDLEIRKMLTELIIDNAKLRKQVNSVMRSALKTEQDESDEIPSRKTVLSKFFG